MAKVQAPAKTNAPSAPAKAAVVAKVEESKIVTIAEIAEDTGVDARKLRAAMRASGFKAPPTAIAESGTGFGPRAKYEFAVGSPEYAQVMELVDTLINQPAKAPKKAKVKAEVEAPAETDEDEE